MLIKIAMKQSLGGRLSTRERRRRGNRIGIDRVGIATGGKNLGVLNNVGAGAGFDVLAMQAAHQRLDFMIGIKLLSNVREQQKSGK